MKQLLSGFTIAAVLLSISITVPAQKSAVNLLTGIAICTPGTQGSLLSVENVHPKAKRHFEKEFKNAKDVQWLQLKDGQMAGFTENEIRYSVYFHPNAGKAGSIKGYPSCKLNNEVQGMVEADFPGYKITYVNEVTVLPKINAPVFVVNIMGAREDVKVIMINEGETIVTYDSSDPGTLAKRF